MGQKFFDNKFDVLVNPFGTLYNPLSIFTLLQHALRKEPLPSEAYLVNQGICRHYYLHSDVSASHQTQLAEKASEVLDKCRTYLAKSECILFTLGTAYVYRHLASGLLAGNCHKMPASYFEKLMLKPEEISSAFDSLASEIRKINPGAQFIFTVSPVRHLSDTLPMNGLSKSVMRVAIQQIIDRVPDTTYFPSFELMIDDLRDYRFYKEDLVHPTDQAVDYIWQKFATSHFTAETQKVLTNWQKIKKSLDHRPFYPASEQYLVFLKKTLSQLEVLQKELPCDLEIEEIKAKIYEFGEKSK
ncbi:MAG: GSCFA domain-containing protein [Cyclobacteriaceae bacterium]|nr:GSCFA domain-containing protein [Cyclobacteriaceae bacterium]